MSASKLVFLGLYGLAVFFSKRMGLLNGILVTLFLFDFVYSGVASQYLIWTVPFLLLTPRRVMFWCYELAATYALVVFYWIFFPDILFGALDGPAWTPLRSCATMSYRRRCSLPCVPPASSSSGQGSRRRRTRSTHGGGRAGAMDAETGHPWPARVFVLSGAICVGDRICQRSEVVHMRMSRIHESA